MLPPYLRSNLGTVFDVPPFGDAQTPALVVPRANAAGVTLDTGAGKGLVNVVLSFSEPQARTFNPGIRRDSIVFDLFPRDALTGPVFVSTLIGDPEDLNDIAEPEDIPLDDVPRDIPRIQIIEVPVLVTSSVEVPTQQAAWISGVDGQLRPGSPPAGWTTQVDGRAYPPLPEPDVCDQADPTGVGVPGGDPSVDPAALTALEQLLEDAKSTAASFGNQTRRRGIILDIAPFLEGVQEQRVSRRVPQLLVVDSVPGENSLRIVRTSSTFLNGQPVPSRTTDNETREYLEGTEFIASFVKENEQAPFSFSNIARTIRTQVTLQIVTEGEKLTVPAELSNEEAQSIRIMGTAAAIVTALREGGPGVPTSQAAPSQRSG